MHRVFIFDAFQRGRSAFPAYRKEIINVRMTANEVFDQIAEMGQWEFERICEERAVLFSNQFIGALTVSCKPEWVSVSLSMHASSLKIIEHIHTRLRDSVRSKLITDPMVSLVWTFQNAKRELSHVAIEEIANDECLDSAYPMIAEGVDCFINRYLSSPESVLVLHGPPGTGKTRLIKQILGVASRSNGDSAKAVYTTDQAAMENDALFASFITGRERFLIVEDADHLLRARDDGNQILHRFLAIADGVVSAQGRKLIFTTNLPGLGDIDAALVRPGRCFSHQFIRTLTIHEALTLLDDLGKKHGITTNGIAADMISSEQKNFSLAEVYRKFRERDNLENIKAELPRKCFGFIGS